MEANNNSNASNNNSVDVGRGFFNTQDDLEEALTILSTTDWDATDKELLISSRSTLSLLMGFQEESNSLLMTQALFQQPSETNNLNAAVGCGPDELDSYESLVRDAGNNLNNLSALFNVNIFCPYFLCRLLTGW